MRYRTLGSSDLVVSEIGVGTWQNVTTADQARTDRLVHTALDEGITFFDTANSYADAPEALARALRTTPRDRYVLSTKLYFPSADQDRAGLGERQIAAGVRECLRRMGTDYVDLLTAHRFDPHTPLAETLSAIAACVRAGTVRHYGFSEWTAEQIASAAAMAEYLGLPAPVGNQPQYSVLWRVPEAAVVPTCQRLGIGQVAFWALAQGMLSGKYRAGLTPEPGTRAADPHRRSLMDHLMLDEVLDRVALFDRLARRQGLTCAQLALAWVLHRPGVSSTLVGVSSPEQVRENAGAAGVFLSAATLELIDKLFAGCVHTDVAATG
ncbi:MAG: aldo/keto reductase [Saccharothrix sp.]|nr:aldo/keto reductase [Saccharothrix sp.]